jgi:DNA-binding LacI/PurR family transcriptional regulator
VGCWIAEAAPHAVDSSPHATLADVSRVAGVSTATVSRVVHGFEGVRPSTRARVDAAINELDYRPNVAARRLRLSPSTRIGLIIPASADASVLDVMWTVADAARDAGLVPLVLRVSAVAPLADAVRLIDAEQPAGIVLFDFAGASGHAVRSRVISVRAGFDKRAEDLWGRISTLLRLDAPGAENNVLL